MPRRRFKRIWLPVTITMTLGLIATTSWLLRVTKEYRSKIASKQLLEPVEIYAEPPILRLGDGLEIPDLAATLERLGYRRRQMGQPLLPGDFMPFSPCSSSASEDIPLCLKVRPKEKSGTFEIQITSGRLSKILAIDQSASELHELELEPELLATFLGDELLWQEPVALRDVPVSCLNAILAIEDHNFLEHSGFNPAAIARAAFRNLLAGRKAEGGSTITQQLVKNHFLSPEKTIERKAKELVMAVLLETELTKDQILELYLNVIYMGQNGPLRVHGYRAAARFYFGRPIGELELHECALLAAIVNSPGTYHPTRHPDRARQRRNMVLDKMHGLGFIDPSNKERSREKPLPSSYAQPPLFGAETAPYFLDGLREQVKALGIPFAGLKIHSSLRRDHQFVAQKALQEHLKRLSQSNKNLARLVEKGKQLEGVFLAANPKTGLISAAVGGQSYRLSQFNRTLWARRQMGSTIKPFVFLTAFEANKALTPGSIINDEKFIYRYQGQSWSPENYDKKFRGDVTLLEALAQSLNASTAKLGIEVGLKNLSQTLTAYGLADHPEPLPSLTLGALETTPLRALRAYAGLANGGRLPEMSYLRRVFNRNGELIYEFQPASVEVSPRCAVGAVVSMLEAALEIGTGRPVRALGFGLPAAGKTGTTSDYRDSWFVGFTPEIAALVWVGFDDNTPTGLTGATGAIPIWVEFMKAHSKTQQDFSWPECAEELVNGHRVVLPR